MATELSGLTKVEEHESQIRAALSGILASPTFQASPGLGRLLTFLVEEVLSNHADNLKETYIGHMVYRRSLTYDPKFDSVVRVNANRLRNRLLEYYAHNPTVSPRIIIRPGSYVPMYEFGAESIYYRKINDQPTSAEVDDEPVWAVDLDEQPAEEIDTTPLLPNTASDQTQTTPVTVRSVRRWATLIVCVLLVGMVIVTSLLFSKKKASRPAEWTGEPFSSLGGQEEFPAISPDGTHLAFSWTEPSVPFPHVYLQALNEHSPKRLTTNTDGETRPIWSPDGTSIAFLHVLSSARTEVMVKSLSSGSEVKVADLHGSYPWLCTIPRLSWTPDGKKIYTSESTGTKEACGVVAIDVATRSQQLITQPPPGSIGDLEAAVSPNGKQIAFLRSAGTLGGDIYVTSLEGEGTRRITFDNRDIMGFCWAPDGNGFIVSSRRRDGVPKLWQISLDGKAAKPLTDGLTLAAFPSISPKGDRIVFTAYRTTTSIRQIINGSEKLLVSDQSSNSTPQISPDGKSLVYRSDRTGSFELWISQLDGNNGIRLTDFKGPMVNNPRWSPDGTWIAFECRPHGQSDICLVNPSRLDQTRVLNQWTSNEIFPSWSYDGKSIYFTSNHSGQWEIYRQAIAGSDPVAITHDGAMRALQSVDGRWLYLFRGEESGEIDRIPASGQPEHLAEADRTATMLIKFGADMLGKWDIYRDGLMYLIPHVSMPSGAGDKERVITINGDTRASQDIGLVDGPSPSGDLIFSASANGKSFVYVRQGLKEGNIGFLVLESAPR